MQNNVVLKDINADLNLTLVQYSANVAGSTWCSCWLLCSCGCCESLATNSFARYLSRWLCTSFGPRVRAASCPQATRQRRSLCDRDVGQLRAAAVLGGIRRTFSLVCSLPSPPRSSRSHFASACRNSAASCARAACSRPLPERARSPSSTSTTSYVSHTSKSEQALLRLGDAHSGVAAPPHRTPRAGSRPWSSTCSRRRPRRACSSCRPPTAAKRHQAPAPSHWHTSSRFTHTHMRACVPQRPFDYRAARDATNTPTSHRAPFLHTRSFIHSLIRSRTHAHTYSLLLPPRHPHDYVVRWLSVSSAAASAYAAVRVVLLASARSISSRRDLGCCRHHSRRVSRNAAASRRGARARRSPSQHPAGSSQQSAGGQRRVLAPCGRGGHQARPRDGRWRRGHAADAAARPQHSRHSSQGRPWPQRGTCWQVWRSAAP